MKTRCLWKAGHKWTRYGGRGIKVCQEWLHSFDQFFIDMGKAPTSKHTLGRINNDGNYTPKNCRWETFVQQANNRKPIKLTKPMVFGIRHDVRKGWTHQFTANCYGVSRACVSLIAENKRHRYAA